MTLMSIIACRIFEDEIIHLIRNDPQITKILVLNSLDAAGVLRKLSENAIEHIVCSPTEIEDFVCSEQDTNYFLLVNMLGFSLDASPQLLKDSVYKEINTMAEYADTILIFYGFVWKCAGRSKQRFCTSFLPCAYSKRRRWGDNR